MEPKVWSPACAITSLPHLQKIIRPRSESLVVNDYSDRYTPKFDKTVISQ